MPTNVQVKKIAIVLASFILVTAISKIISSAEALESL